MTYSYKCISIKSLLPKAITFLVFALLCSMFSSGAHASSSDLSTAFLNLGNATSDDVYTHAYYVMQDVLTFGNFPGFAVNASMVKQPYHRTFEGCFVPAVDGALLALYSDDGSVVYNQGLPMTDESAYDTIQDLEDLSSSLKYCSDQGFIAGQLYNIKLNYSSVYTDGSISDIDGCILYAYNGGGDLANVNLQVDSDNNGSITADDDYCEEDWMGMCIKQSKSTLVPANISIDSRLQAANGYYCFEIRDENGDPISNDWIRLYADDQGQNQIYMNTDYGISTLPSQIYIQQIYQGTGTLELVVKDNNGGDLTRDKVKITVISDDSPRVVDVTSSSPDGCYGVNYQYLHFTVTFDQPVRLSPGTTLQLSLATGRSGANATYYGTVYNGGTVITFYYKTQNGDNTYDLDCDGYYPLQVLSGRFTDISGNDITAYFPEPGAPHSLSANKNIAIRTTRNPLARCYVKTGGSNTNDGSSWNNALQTISAACNARPTEIWVAQGTYTGCKVYGDTKLYGGFYDGLTSFNQRNLRQFVCTIEGDGARPVLYSDESVGGNIVVDGFTVQHGSVGLDLRGATINNNIITDNHGENGGGIALHYRIVNGAVTNSPSTITNNIISNNSAKDGAGIYADYCTVTAVNNVIENNTAEGRGSGIFGYCGTLLLSNNRISNNSAATGGGVAACYDKNDIISANRITGNSAGKGAGVYLQTPSIVKCSDNMITQNNSTGNGGGIAIQTNSNYDNISIINNTICGNTAALGGGICNISGYNTGCLFANNIVCFNSSGIAKVTGAASPALNTNCVYGNTSNNNYVNVTPGSSDISQDPLFIDSSSSNYHLTQTSPCIDTGNDSANMFSTTDVDGETRKTDIPGRGTALIDIGADEYQSGIYLSFTAPSSNNLTILSSDVITLSGIASYNGGPIDNVSVTIGSQTYWADYNRDTKVWSYNWRYATSGTVTVTAYYNGSSAQVSRTFTIVVNPRVWYVKPANSGAQDGSSWARAFTTITEALNFAEQGDEIWVAAGKYDHGFTMKAGVGFYGGFAGNETQRGQRNWKTNLSVIQLYGDSVSAPGDTSNTTTVLDGFTILDGGRGVNLENINTNILVAHNIFKRCYVGIYGLNTDPSLSVRIVDNYMTYNGYSGITWEATNDSTGIVIANNTITHCYSEMDLMRFGYGIVVNAGSVNIANNITAYNRAGIWIISDYCTVVRNCSFGNDGNDFWRFTPVPGDGNMTSDALLLDIHIHSTSPCRDASINSTLGNSYVLPGDTDIDGQPRNADGIVDIGADESTGCDLGILTLTSSAHIVPINTSATVTASMKDITDQNMSGCQVTFTTSGGCGVSLNPSSGVTDSNGNVQTSFTSTCQSVVTITATAVQPCGGEVKASTNVIFVDSSDTRVRDIEFIIDSSASMYQHEASYPCNPTSPDLEASVQRFVREMSQVIPCKFGYAIFNSDIVRTRSITQYTGANKVEDFCESVESEPGYDTYCQLQAFNIVADDLAANSPAGHLRYIAFVTDDMIPDMTDALNTCERLDSLTASGGGIYLSLWENSELQNPPLYGFYSHNFTSDPAYPSLAINGGFDSVNWINDGRSLPSTRYTFDKLMENTVLGQ